MITYRGSSAAPARKSGALGCLIIAAVIVLIMGSVGYFALYPAWNARLNGIQTQGNVINVSVCQDDSGGDTVVRPYLAQDSGNSVTAEIVFTDLRGQKQDVWENNCGDYTQGQTVALWYLPNDPQTFTTDQQLNGTIIAAVVMSIIGGPSVIVLLIALLRLLFFVPFALLVAARQSRQPQPAYASPAYQPPSVANAAYYPSAAASAYSPSTPASAAPQLAPATTRITYRVGQTAEINNLCAATLTRVTTSYGDVTSLPAPGQVYLLVSVALRNRSSQPLDAFSAGRFQLWDTQSREYQPTLLPGTVFYLTDMLEPGQQQDEQLAFSVPAAIHEYRLTFQRDRSGAPLATWEITV
ncbi:MAG TPA: DUF4352 domain-containing protein [Ktedonobacterales bacterium]|nr:DUF4352 domain-containing protein [Ktedonobacterales bacterium]